jgi:hypothetical protein
VVLPDAATHIERENNFLKPTLTFNWTDGELLKRVEGES